MREQGWLLGNYILFLICTIFLVTLQCSLWLQVFGSFSPPHMWLPPLVYWFLYRRTRESVIMVYLVSVIASTMTAMPLGHFLFINMTLFTGIYLLKQRIYWTGSTFFMLACGACAGAFPLIHWILTWIADRNPISDPPLFEWIIRTLLTMLLCYPAHWLFSWFDQITHKEQLSETEVT